ncbi:hypothetical protein L2E82_02244 [Cichorium intybus]|uniref:Uncharacterized protein n=1 Tax=Cichorium intybus TaxID=13427 RepID=A0ACB9H125_CICIN|nr:hypothetical protein L2E82_02244 [Cichorium intybus]
MLADVRCRERKGIVAIIADSGGETVWWLAGDGGHYESTQRDLREIRNEWYVELMLADVRCRERKGIVAIIADSGGETVWWLAGDGGHCESTQGDLREIRNEWYVELMLADVRCRERKGIVAIIADSGGETVWWLAGDGGHCESTQRDLREIRNEWYGELMLADVRCRERKGIVAIIADSGGETVWWLAGDGGHCESTQGDLREIRNEWYVELMLADVRCRERKGIVAIIADSGGETVWWLAGDGGHCESTQGDLREIRNEVKDGNDEPWWWLSDARFK